MKLLTLKFDQLAYESFSILLMNYALIPISIPLLTRMSGRNDAETKNRQNDFAELLKDQRKESTEFLIKLMEDQSRLTISSDNKSYAFQIHPHEGEELLKILNTIKISSWEALGKPEDPYNIQPKTGDMYHLSVLHWCSKLEDELLNLLMTNE